jgi:hypothetical protein
MAWKSQAGGMGHSVHATRSFHPRSAKQTVIPARVHGGMDLPPEEGLRTERFYAESVAHLLDVLADATGSSVIPDAALQMYRAIWQKLPCESVYQREFARFVVNKWLIPQFLLDAITLPEVSRTCGHVTKGRSLTKGRHMACSPHNIFRNWGVPESFANPLSAATKLSSTLPTHRTPLVSCTSSQTDSI